MKTDKHTDDDDDDSEEEEEARILLQIQTFI
jgi:hypothetical protein